MYEASTVRSVLLLPLVLLVALAVTSYAAVAEADPRTEAVAKAALKKVEADFLAQNYGTGAARLEKALKACGAKKCVAATRAALLRDLGTMSFRKGDKDVAAKYFADAVALQPDLALNPAYDAPDVRKAFAAAKGGGGGGGGGGGAEQPSGDFTHTPPAEQKVDTPLPIYLEGGGDVVRIVVKYKVPGGSSWKRIDMKKVGDGWGALIPCADVQSGTLRYYIQGFDASKEATANNGDTRHPYAVEIKDDISGDPPHLPGKKAPKSCHESSDCPPDFPGCSKKGESAGENGEESGEGGDKEEDKPKGSFKRIWIGLSGTIDLQSMPAGQDLCHLDPNTALPANSANVYCTNRDGTDFPSRSSPAQNEALQPGQAGQSNGGVQRGEARLMLSFDYAITANILVGARIGVSFYPYPGQAAYNDGRAWNLLGSRLYLDARGTYLLGDNAITKTIAPMGFLGLGAASFDTSTSAGITLSNGQSGTVNLWQTNGPFFLLLGAGIHVAMTESFAGTLAARLNLSFGPNGMIPTFGPEVGLAYGF